MSSVKLLSVRKIPEASAEDEYIWVYQMNGKWIPFPDATSSSIEKAFRWRLKEISIDGHYRIDLKYYIQEHADDPNCKQSIRRRQRSFKSSVSSNEGIENDSRLCDRFSFHLGLVSGCSASVDTNYYGSPFIAGWFLTFTKGKQPVTFDSIFPALVEGLQEEGQTEPEHVVHNIVDSLKKIRDKVFRKSEKERMEELENYCAELYTKPYFLYRIVNIALRDNDHTKQRTLGPYCFLVFNYIGRHLDDNFSIHRRLRQILRSTKPQLMTVYRGDYVSSEMIEEYRQAVGNKSKYFKWLSFVSTSCDHYIAKQFAINVLYIIELKSYSFEDQFVDMSMISSFKEEKEIVLQPGVRFQVIKVEYDDMEHQHLVYIIIVPSYVSSLR